MQKIEVFIAQYPLLRQVNQLNFWVKKRAKFEILKATLYPLLRHSDLKFIFGVIEKISLLFFKGPLRDTE